MNGYYGYLIVFREEAVYERSKGKNLPLDLIFYEDCMWISMETIWHIRISFKNRNWQKHSGNWSLSEQRGVTVTKQRRKWHGSIHISHISEKIFYIKSRGKIANSYDVVCIEDLNMKED